MIRSDTIDISVLVSPDTPVWPGDTPFSCMWTWNMADGASVNVSATTSSPHAGTHADTPLHVSLGGTASESLDVTVFCGEAVVIDVTGIEHTIELEAIEAQLNRSHSNGVIPARILLRSGRSIADGSFPNNWPSLSVDCAHALVGRGLRLLGVDSPSVDDCDSKSLDVHHALLDNGACVLENLDLRHVGTGFYILTALPLSVAGLDAAPVRAILTRQ